VTDGAVYVGAHGDQGIESAPAGALFVLDFESGRERWRALLGDGPIDATPAVFGGMAFVYVDYGRLYAPGGDPAGVGSPGARP
jgi:outer membrane protein assembly factor BamB